MSTIKNGIINIIVYGCGLVIVNGASFLMLPFYTRQFVPSEYAIITLLLTCLPFTRYCLPLEVSQAAPVFSSDNLSKSSSYISVGFWFTVLMNLLCYSIAFTINHFFQFTTLSTLNLVGLFLLLFVDCLFYYTSNILRWQLRHYLYNFIISSVALVEVFLIILFVFYAKLSIAGVFYAWMISRSIGFLLNYFFTSKEYNLFFNFSILKKMLAFSVPIAISNLPYNANRSFDRWLIAKLLGLSAVGIYGAGSMISGIVGFVMGTISSAMGPTVYKNHQHKESPVEILRLFYIVVTGCMLIAIFFALFNKEILKILITRIYYNPLCHNPILPIFVLSAILSGLHIFFPGFNIKRKTMQIVWLNTLSLIVNIILTVLLVFKWGMTGVALGTCLSMLVNVSLYMMFNQKYYPLPFQFKHIFPYISLFFILYIGAIWLGIISYSFRTESILARLLYGLLAGTMLVAMTWKIVQELSRIVYKPNLIDSLETI